MILRRLSVEGFRCFRSKLELALPDAPVVVLAGPNGVGKSTLLEAVVRCLLDNHGATGAAVEALRPWGTGLSPEIEVEFEHAGRTWRVRKRFLERPYARLERLSPDGRWGAVAENKEADRRLRKLLAAEEIHRGLAKRTHPSLLRVLFTPQGHLPLGSLDGPLLEQLREALGASLAGEAGRQAEKKLEALYSECFTRTGKEKKGSRVTRLRDELADAEKAAADAREKLRQIDGLRTRAGTAARELAAAKAALEELKPGLAAAEKAAEEWKRLKTEERVAEARQREAETSLRALEKRIEEIEGLRRRLAELRQGREEAEAAVKKAEAAEVEARKQLEEAEQSYRTAKERGEHLRRLERRLEAAREWRVIAGEQQELAALRSRLAQIDGEAAALRKQIAQLRAPDRTELSRFREVAAEIVRLRERIDAAMIHAEFAPEAPADVTVVEGEPPTARRLEPGAAFEVAGEGKVEIHVAGVGRFRARGPVGDLPALRQQLEEHSRRLAELAAPFGTDDLAVLEERAEQRERLEGRMRDLETERITRLGEMSERRIAERLAELEARRRELAAEHPEWESAAPSVEAVETEVASLRKGVQSELEAAELRRRELQQRAVETRLRWNESHSTLKGVLREIEEKSQRLVELESDGLSREARRAKLRERRLHWEDLTRRLDEIREKLNGMPPDAAERAEALHEKAAALERAVRERQSLKLQAEADLRATLQLAPYEALVEAEETLQETERRLREAEAQAQAVRLVWDCVQEAKQSALGDLARPVAEEAARLLERIAGARMAALRLGEDFGVAGLEPVDGPPDVPADQFSGGEQEQIHLAVRLALARILAERERHLVVLDDVLLSTDDERLGRILELLDEWSGRMQFLILTCHAERYRALRRARFLELAGGKVREMDAPGRAAG